MMERLTQAASFIVLIVVSIACMFAGGWMYQGLNATQATTTPDLYWSGILTAGLCFALPAVICIVAIVLGARDVIRDHFTTKGEA